MANNDEYTDEYNDEYLCRDFFVGFNQVSIFDRGYHSRYQNFEFTGESRVFLITEQGLQQKSHSCRNL